MEINTHRLSKIEGNKRLLLDAVGYKSIKLFRKDNEEFENDEEAYDALLLNYNFQIDYLAKQKEKQKRKQIKFIKNENIRQIKDFRQQFIQMRINQQKSITIPINKNLSVFDNVKNAINTIEDINKDQKFNLKINGKYYALTNLTKYNLFKTIENDIIQKVENFGSDTEFAYLLNNVDEFTLEVFEKQHKNEKHNGAFFKYINKTKFELQKYQIFNKINNSYYDIYPYNNYFEKYDKNKKITFYDNCLIYALRILGLEDKKLEILKLKCKVDNIPLCKLNDICNELEICIKMRREYYSNDNKISESFVEIFGNEKNRTYHLGLLDEHYFINEKTNITSFSITNYEEVKDLQEFHLIAYRKGKYYIKDRNRTLMSYDVIKLLLKNKDKLLEPIKKLDMSNNQLHNFVDNDITELNDDFIEDKHYRELTIGENANEIELNRMNIYYDFETYTSSLKKIKKKKMETILIHKPYLCCYIDDNNNKNYFCGEDCGLQMLIDISLKYKNVRMIAHNATYDIRFLYKYLYDIKETCRGNKLITCKAKFNNCNILLKDSYLLISMALANFPETFNILGVVKEVISYKLYNETDAVKNVFIKINETIDYLKQEDKDIKQFEENLKKWNLIEGEYYNCIDYSKNYCLIDCYILKEGYNKFKEWLIELVNINIDYVPTIASLSHKYFIQQGCYGEVYELGGVAQAFIQKCVVGGRTMICNNEKKKLTNYEGNDFDAVSLYASAMKRMEGFLIGLPKLITNLDYEDLKNKDGYFIEIKINKIKIKRNFPLASYITEEGVRNWTNDITCRNIYIDKIALEDLIKFQEVDFDIIRGYYFDEGFNNRINYVIDKLFNERKKLKEQKNNAEIIYKLIMNSGYGKSIINEIETNIKYFNDKKKMDIFISRNYNWVVNWEQMNESNSWKVKVIKPISNHFNIAQVGVSILSWSKRIMNEVICLAEDNSIPIYYQDTDSIHIDNKNINTLSDLFEDKYKRKLIGKDLGQFHSDFEMEGCKNIIATDSIFLGKKCYIDKLKGEDKITGEIKTDYHIRLKGVPNGCINFTAKKLNYKDVFELYNDLYNGKEISFDLTQDGNKANFKFENNGTVRTLQEFTRIIKFPPS